MGVFKVKEAIAALLLTIITNNLQVFQKAVIAGITASFKSRQESAIGAGKEKKFDNTCCFNINELFILDEEDNITEVLLGFDLLKDLLASISHRHT